MIDRIMAAFTFEVTPVVLYYILPTVAVLFLVLNPFFQGYLFYKIYKGDMLLNFIFLGKNIMSVFFNYICILSISLIFLIGYVLGAIIFSFPITSLHLFISDFIPV